MLWFCILGNKIFHFLSQKIIYCISNFVFERPEWKTWYLYHFLLINCQNNQLIHEYYHKNSCEAYDGVFNVVWMSRSHEFVSLLCLLQVTAPFTSECVFLKALGVGGATAGEPATRTERRSWRGASLTSRTQKTTTRPATASSNLSVSSDGLRVSAD